MLCTCTIQGKHLYELPNGRSLWNVSCTMECNKQRLLIDCKVIRSNALIKRNTVNFNDCTDNRSKAFMVQGEITDLANVTVTSNSNIPSQESVKEFIIINQL